MDYKILSIHYSNNIALIDTHIYSDIFRLLLIKQVPSFRWYVASFQEFLLYKKSDQQYLN